VVEPSAVASSVVSSPVAGSVPPAAVGTVERGIRGSAVTVVGVSGAPPAADPVAPAPVPWASECDELLAELPPAVEWLSDCALADAARARWI